METVTVSKKYPIVVPEKLRKKSGIKPGDKRVALTKHGIIHYIPIRPIRDTEGFTLRLDTESLRDESDRV